MGGHLNTSSDLKTVQIARVFCNFVSCVIETFHESIFISISETLYTSSSGCEIKLFFNPIVIKVEQKNTLVAILTISKTLVHVSSLQPLLVLTKNKLGLDV